MKVAVIKLGSRIIFGNKIGTSGGAGEAYNLIMMLANGGAEVDCYTQLMPDDTEIHNVRRFDLEQNIEKIYDAYDALVVINGNITFFGGEENRLGILNYKLINNFIGPVFYIYCDPSLELKQIWPDISRKKWASNWNQDDIEIKRPINVISQSYNLQMVKEIFEKQNIVVGSVVQYPFQKFPLLKFAFSDSSALVEDRDIDLIYGGTYRSGRRENKIVEFYFGYPEDIKVEIFGKIKEDNFTPKKIENLSKPMFSKSVDYSDMINKMRTAKAHVVIGDSRYPKIEMIAQRVYESMLAGCVTFIDESLDHKRRVFGETDIGEFSYVRNRDEAVAKIRTLNGVNDWKQMAENQLTSVNFDPVSYCNGFVETILSNGEKR